MAEESDARVLQLLRRARQHRSIKCLRPAAPAFVAADLMPPQSAWPCVVGSVDSGLSALDSSSPRFASLSFRTLRRYSSKVGAVCVNALVRFCAGAISNGRPYRVGWDARPASKGIC